MATLLSPIVESFSGDVSSSSYKSCSCNNNDKVEEVESLLDCGRRLLLNEEPLQILVEIVGATGLIHPSYGNKNRGSGRNLQQETETAAVDQEAENANSNNNKLVNAYVTINFQNRVIHATKTVKQDNNPVWDVSTRSIFLFQPNASEWLSATDNYNDGNKLTILVCHETTGIKGDKVIGRISLDPCTVLTHCNEQRVEFDLEDAPTVGSTSSSRFSFRQTCRRATLLKSKYSSSTIASSITGNINRSSTAFHNFYSEDDNPPCGSIALRFRLATTYDLQFLRRLNSNYNMLSKLPNELVLSTERDEHTAFGEGMLNAVKTQLKKGMAIGSKKAMDGSNKYLVKPGPDPSRPREETEWLSKDELVEECVKPSTNWVITGTGSDGAVLDPSASLGRVYLEILSCQDLPNMDVGGAVGNLTDCFVAAVYEDTMVDTTVIDDELSPMWMPWTTRAFIFHMKHPLSPLYIGAFDYDIGLVNAHEGIGRVAINLQNFFPGTSYTLDYQLYPSSNVTERQSFGTITIRLRIELHDERAYILAGLLNTPPRFHVNVTKEKSLAVVRYIVNGAYEDEKFDLMVLRSYVSELFEYQALMNYTVGDAMTSLLLWRPQWHFGVVSVPIHSILAFVIGSFLVENPRMLPSFTLFGIAWMMVASMGSRVHHPSPWLRCKSFFTYLDILLRGSCPTAFEVAPGEGAEAAKRLDAAWKDRRKADAEKSEKLWELQIKLNDIGKEDIHAGTKIKQLDPLAAYLPILLRMQKRLRGLCDSIRRLYCVLRWEDSLLSFGLTCSCFMAGALLLVLPWEYILYWVCRICVWTFLGPWMKLVDVYIIKHNASLSLDGDERKKVKANELKEAMTQFNKQSKVARLRGEEALKNSSMRSLVFGTFSAPIPERNVTRHFDYPLSNSMATCSEEALFATTWENINCRNILRGQKLDGVMIPCHVADRKKDESVASPTVQEKVKALEAVALHSVTLKRPTLEGHRTSKPVAVIQEKIKVNQENNTQASPKIELKKSQRNPSIESQPADVVPVSRRTKGRSLSPRKNLKNSTNSTMRMKDIKRPSEHREALEEKTTEVDKKDEVEEQGMEICVAFAGNADLPLEVDTTFNEENVNNPENNNSQYSSPHPWTSSPSYKSTDYIDVIFLRK